MTTTAIHDAAGDNDAQSPLSRVTEADKNPQYFYFVGEDKYKTDAATVTGAQIKARIADIEPGTGLSLEGQGNDPDRMIGDDETVDLEIGHGQGPRRFALVPPATFG